MNALIWVLTGMLAGGLARLAMRRRSYGWSGDLLLGLLGGLVGGWVFRMAGITTPDDGLRHGVIALFGAVIVLAVSRALRPVHRETMRAFGEAGAHLSLEAQLKRLGKIERQVFEKMLHRGPRPEDPNTTFDAQLTFGQRVADNVARFGGSWTFIGVFFALMIIWMVINTETRTRFDPYPFILLNLALSCLAALQAPVIMMSQNRMAAKDRLDARTDYEVNVRAELEIQRLHAKVDELREREWIDLVASQRQQIELLERIIRRLEGDGRGQAKES